MDGENFKKAFPVKFKKNERLDIVEFANTQSNFNDTVRYLIEKEIAENGIRNLQEHIPPVRDSSYFQNLRRIPILLPVEKKKDDIPSCYE